MEKLGGYHYSRDPYWHVKIGHGDLEEISSDAEQEMIAKAFEFDEQRDSSELEPILNQSRAWSKQDEEKAIDEWRHIKWQKIYWKITRRINQSDIEEDLPVRLDQEVEILNDIEHGKPVLIQAVFGMGKTQTLRALMQHVYGKRHSLFFDNWSLDDNMTTEEFLKAATSDITQLLYERTTKSDTEPKDYDDYDKQVKALKAAITKTGDPFRYLNDQLALENDSVLVAIDEFTGQSQELLDLVSNLTQYPHIKLVCIVNVLGEEDRNVYKEKFKDFSWHFLRPLTLEETGSMMRRFLRETPIIMSDRAVESVWKFSGGFPRVVASFFQELITKLGNGSPKFIIRSADIEQSIQPFLTKTERSGYGLTQNVLEDMARALDFLHPNEKEVLKRILKDGILEESDITEDEQSAIRVLLGLGMIRKHARKKKYSINGEFLEYVLKKREKK